MPDTQGDRVPLDDERLAELRRACGEEEWAEAGFSSGEGVAYGAEVAGQLVATGNMAPFSLNPPIGLGRPTRRPGSGFRWTMRANGGSKASAGR